VSGTELVLTIDGGGVVTAVWDDALAGLVELAETVECWRASHIEMRPDGLWQVDFLPVNGPILGGYRLRADALTAEREWLARHLAVADFVRKA
jgi:hypothetical protein